MIYSASPEGSTAAWRAGHRCAVVLAGCLLSALLATGAHAQAARETLVLDAARLWDFAESLERQGEHYRAITEYKRLRFFFPDDARARAAELRIGLAYLRGGEAGQAVTHLRGALERDAADPAAGYADTLRFALALGYLERGRERPYPLRLDGIEAALRTLEEIGAESPAKARAAGFAAALREPPELPEKSPWLAGTLSAVVPGAGSFYVGRYAEGSLALFVNAVLIYATVNSFQREQVAAGTVFGALALAFYGGAIYAAANGAHKFNGRALAAYLEEQRVTFGIVVPPAGGIAAAFGADF